MQSLDFRSLPLLHYLEWHLHRIHFHADLVQKIETDNIVAASSAANSNRHGGHVAAAAMFPCRGCHSQQLPEARFYRDADGNRYKMCMTCIDRERKRDRAKEAMARVTNAEYDSMFLQPSSALTVFATHSLSAKSATRTKKAHTTPSFAFSSLPANNTMNDNHRKNVHPTPPTTSPNTTNTSKTTDTMAPTTSPAPDKLSATSSVTNEDSGQVVAGATFPCSGCNHRQRPEASFYRDANGNPYKRCIRCTDRRRKGGKGQGAVAGAINDE
jgi:hypothetical protein